MKFVFLRAGNTVGKGEHAVFKHFLIMLFTHYQTTNFRLFQVERVCRRQFQIWRKWKKVIQTGRKHCGKRRNCSLRAISPFPSVFKRLVFQGLLCGNRLIDFFLEIVNSLHCVARPSEVVRPVQSWPHQIFGWRWNMPFRVVFLNFSAKIKRIC